jgi:uncharacterized protein (TIGR02453 family)
MERILAFLNELKINNNREWFNANKSWYKESKIDFEKWVFKLIDIVSGFDKDLRMLTPKDCVFRIYRDVRFSKNKEPYKTHFGVSLNKGGRNSKFAGYYFQVEPGNSFVGGGKWQPPPDILKAIRYEIYNNVDEFKSIIRDKSFKLQFGDMIPEKIQRPPKDFPSDFVDVELLKYKSYIVGSNIQDSILTNDNLLSHVSETFKIMHPFINFLNRGINQ